MGPKTTYCAVGRHKYSITNNPDTNPGTVKLRKLTNPRLAPSREGKFKQHGTVQKVDLTSGKFLRGRKVLANRYIGIHR